MRNYLTFKLTLLVLLVFGASSPNLAVSASSQQPPAKNVEPEQVNPGDRITVHEKSGRVLELIVEEVNTTDQIASGPDITGTYISEDSGEVFTITQTGDEISGTYGPSGKIWGTIRGNTISLDFFRTGGWTGVGEWKVNSDGSRLQGSWTSSSRNSSGKWNLTRLDPVVATRHVDPPKIKGRLVSDQSAVEVLLTDIDKIEAQLFVAASDDSTVSTTTREASPSKSSKSGDSKFGQGYSKCILGAAMYGLQWL
jgi:hypothetical protein